MIPPRTWLFGDMAQAETRVVAWRGPVPSLKKWFLEGRDVHSNTTQMIARVIQENKLKIHKNLFHTKHWSEYGKGDEEREVTKRVAHGYDNVIGKKRVSLILGVPEATAQMLLDLHGKVFPEIASGYHAWIRHQIKTTRTLVTPEPVRFRKVFWDLIDDDVLRQAYASYKQIIVASILNQTLYKCARIFAEDHDETLREQWCAWYGRENLDLWRRLHDRQDRSPQAILWGGMDIRLNVHDAGGISVPDDPDILRWAANTWRAAGEVPIYITPEDPLIIPIDFKTGPTWGNLHDYKIPA